MKFWLKGDGFVKIHINGRFLTKSVIDVQRYAIELVKSLDTLIECGEIDSSRYSRYFHFWLLTH